MLAWREMTGGEKNDCVPLEDLVSGIPRGELEELWEQLGFDGILGPCKGRPVFSLARDIVGFYDSEVLAQKPIRDALLLNFEKEAFRLVKQYSGVSRRMKDWPSLLIPKWQRGGVMPVSFCEAFRISPKYAGETSPPKPPTIEELGPRPVVHPLMPFQEDLCQQIVEAVRNQEACRIMASLPTGAGKTRVAVNAIMRLQEELGGVVLWIGNTKEVCEQAASTYKAVYENHPPDFPGRIHRLWENHSLKDDFLSGFLVAGIAKLGALDRKNKVVKRLRDAVTLIVFDEAHHAVARTYKQTLRFFAGTPNIPRTHLVGLTATPGRGIDPDGSQVKALVKEFGAQMLVPSQFGKKNPVLVLQREGILSRFRVVSKAGCEVLASEDERTQIERFANYPASLLRRIGGDESRNELIIQQVTRDNTNQKTIVFACDVQQAELLAYQWRTRNVSARAISANTHASLRRKWIRDFVEGGIRVLVNVGVLTTGFDAPIVRRLIMARPTASPVLFEQMIGRGLRGPKFGGTENCTVIDIVDSIKFHGRPRGFQKFEHDWMKGKRLKG